MPNDPHVQGIDLARLAEILATLLWKASFSSAMQHRKVRRVAPEEPGVRFVCTDENGIHACTAEEIELGKPLDLYDLVPKNRAATLEKLIAESSDRRGALKDQGWALLTSEVASHGASETQLARLETHRQSDALSAFFVGVELALDSLKLPALQWRNGLDEHGNPRY